MVSSVATYECSSLQSCRRKAASLYLRGVVKDYMQRRRISHAEFQLCSERLFGLPRQILFGGALAREFAKRAQLRLNVLAGDWIPKAIFVGQQFDRVLFQAEELCVRQPNHCRLWRDRDTEFLAQIESRLRRIGSMQTQPFRAPGPGVKKFVLDFEFSRNQRQLSDR